MAAILGIFRAGIKARVRHSNAPPFVIQLKDAVTRGAVERPAVVVRFVCVAKMRVGVLGAVRAVDKRGFPVLKHWPASIPLIFGRQNPNQFCKARF